MVGHGPAAAGTGTTKDFVDDQFAQHTPGVATIELVRFPIEGQDALRPQIEKMVYLQGIDILRIARIVVPFPRDESVVGIVGVTDIVGIVQSKRADMHHSGQTIAVVVSVIGRVRADLRRLANQISFTIILIIKSRIAGEPVVRTGGDTSSNPVAVGVVGKRLVLGGERRIGRGQLPGIVVGVAFAPREGLTPKRGDARRQCRHLILDPVGPVVGVHGGRKDRGQLLGPVVVDLRHPVGVVVGVDRVVGSRRHGKKRNPSLADEPVGSVIRKIQRLERAPGGGIVDPHRPPQLVHNGLGRAEGRECRSIDGPRLRDLAGHGPAPVADAELVVGELS